MMVCRALSESPRRERTVERMAATAPRVGLAEHLGRMKSRPWICKEGDRPPLPIGSRGAMRVVI